MNRLASAPPAARGLVVAIGGLAFVLAISSAACLIALAGLGRLTPDLDFARLPAWLWYYRGDPGLQRWLAIGAAISTLATLVMAGAAILNVRRPLHGAARWASGPEQRQAGLRATSGILLGRSDAGFLVADGPEHVMLYAPTRTGKGVGVVIPNLLAWPGSVVVLDIKRENFLATAGFRAESGQTVFLFDPLDATGATARFNPLGHFDRTDPIVVLDELQRLSMMLFPTSTQADPFWSEAARMGFVGVAAYVAATPTLPFTLGEVFRQLTDGDPRQRFPRLIEERRGGPDLLSAPCIAALTDFCASSENTFASIRQSITSRMGLWLNPIADAATAASDFDLRDLRAGRTSLYLGASPENIARVAPLYSLLFQQLVDLSSRSLPTAMDQPVLVLLDEFARLGPAPVLAHAFSWVAGYGLRLLPVIQGPAQLRAIYGPDVTEDILTNCGIEVVFAPKDVRVAQQLSERLGAYTYGGRSLSRPRGLGAGRRSITVADQRRPLMRPQQLMQMPSQDLLVLKTGVAPVRGRKIVYYRDQVFRRRLRPPPQLKARPIPLQPAADAADSSETSAGSDHELDAVLRAFAAEGVPPPAPGASEADLREWIEQIIPVPSMEAER